jgi:EAL domain-containing protein (putative c-di-GMP-specific phosphodiesterase class I)
VVAEGIETEDVWQRLAQKGCRYFQGYLFGRALPAPDDPRDLAARPPRQVR